MLAIAVSVRRDMRASQSDADFSRPTVAIKIDILKNKKHFIITKYRNKSIFEKKTRKNIESGFFPESVIFLHLITRLFLELRKTKLYKNL